MHTSQKKNYSEQIYASHYFKTQNSIMSHSVLSLFFLFKVNTIKQSTHSHMDSGKALVPAITHKPAHRGEHQEEGKWGRGCPLVAVAVPEVVERGINE